MTLNQVIKKIKAIGENHLQIKTFYSGDVLDYIDESANVKHASFVCQQNGASVSRGRCEVRFALFFMDWCLPGIENEQNVWSDQLLIAQDVLAILRNPDFNIYDWEINETSEVSFFTEAYEDSLSGCKLDISIAFDYESNRCQVPTISEPVEGIIQAVIENNNIPATYILEVIVGIDDGAGFEGELEITNANFAGVKVEVTRGGLPLPSINPQDGGQYFTKPLPSDTVLFSSALVYGEYLKIKTIPY